MLKTNPLHCTFRRVGSKLIAHVRSSQIDDAMAEHLVSEIKQRIDAGPECEHLTLDFHQVKQAGSSCLSFVTCLGSSRCLRKLFFMGAIAQSDGQGQRARRAFDLANC